MCSTSTLFLRPFLHNRPLFLHYQFSLLWSPHYSKFFFGGDTPGAYTIASVVHLYSEATNRESKCIHNQGKKISGRGGIRTHAIEMTGALNQRLRPLGHPTT